MKIEDKGALLHTIVQVKWGVMRVWVDKGQMWYHALKPGQTWAKIKAIVLHRVFCYFRVSLKAGLEWKQAVINVSLTPLVVSSATMLFFRVFCASI